MPDLPKHFVKLAVELVKFQAKQFLGDNTVTVAAQVIADLAGEAATEKLTNFFDQLDKLDKIRQAFVEAEACFDQTCKDERLKGVLRQKSLTRVEALEKLALNLPKTLDAGGLKSVLRASMLENWRGLVKEAQLDNGVQIYFDCLSKQLVVKCDQLGVWTFLGIQELIDEVRGIKRDVKTLLDGQTETLSQLREIKSELIDAHDLARLGPRSWLRPTPPRPSVEMIGRVAELGAVTQLLTPGARAAITGTAAAVQGTPGIGKTLLAEHVAAMLEPQFAGGVLFQRLGVGFRNPEQANPILNTWGMYAWGGARAKEGLQFTPEAVRALLAEQERLLVVLDDVWNEAAIASLLAALPTDACLLVTTRSQQVARELHVKLYPLEVLTDDDALALLYARMDKATEADKPLLKRLAEALGNHAQALDIAGRSLARRGRARWPEAVDEMARQVLEGSGFGDLPPLPGDEIKVNAVEAALFTSYSDLSKTMQARFRALGAFAPDALFGIHVGILWDCEPVEAEGQLTAFVERGLLTRTEGDARWQQHSLLRAYALALLRREGEEDEARQQHANTYLALMRHAHDKQIYHQMLPDYFQLHHAFDWAIEHDLAVAISLTANTANLQGTFNLLRDNYDWTHRVVSKAALVGDDSANAAAIGNLASALARSAMRAGEDRRRRLMEALAAFGEALKHFDPKIAPLDFATTQNNRARLLRELAPLAGEDRQGRLMEALAANDEALKYQRPEVAPLDYATTQNNRGLLLSDLATLAGEDRRGRLMEALAAFDKAVKYRRPDVTPLGYAETQNDRATLLNMLATLVGEDRRMRLMEALVAYDEALKYRRPEIAPLGYAETQNNRAINLRELATLPEEDQRGRLMEALAACDEALKYRRPEIVPLDYAATQNNRANILRELATLPKEDQRGRLMEALAAHDEALKYRRPEVAPLDYAGTQNNRGLLLSDLATLAGEDRRRRLMEALTAYEEALRHYRPEVALLEFAMTQSNLAILFRAFAALPDEDYRECLLKALTRAYTAHSFFEQLGHVPLAQQTANLVFAISRECGELFDEIWAELNVGEPPQWLLGKLVPMLLRQPFAEFLQAQGRAKADKTLEAWQFATSLGQQLLAHPDIAELPISLDELQIMVAECWNQVGVLLGKAQNYAEALTAFGEAIDALPNNAMLYYNHARANIELGNCEAAGADLSRAAELEPEYPRLVELRRAWEEKCKK